MDANGFYHTCQLQDFRSLGAAAVNTECRDLLNPADGFMHFDHAGGALIVVIQSSIPDAQYEVLTRSLDSEPDAWLLTAAFFGIFVSAFCTFMELGLFLAVIAKTYAAVEGEHAEKRASLKDESLAVFAAADTKSRVKCFLDRHEFLFLLYTAVTLQAVVLAIEGYAMVESRQVLLDMFGDVNLPLLVHMACNIFFGAELVLLFAGEHFSVQRFARKSGNLFFSLVFILSVVGFILTYPGAVPQSIADVFPKEQIGKVLKSLAALRLYRLMKILPTMNHILSEAISSLRSILNISVFLFLCTFCTAVCGRYLISDNMKGRSNFSDLSSATLTSFQVFTADSWTGILYDAMTAGTTPFWSCVNAVFVILWLVFSKFVIGNLFIATLVTHIKVSQTMDDIAQDGMQHRLAVMVRERYKQLLRWKDGVQRNTHNMSSRILTNIGGTMGVSSSRGGSLTNADERDTAHLLELGRIPMDQMSDVLKMVMHIAHDSQRQIASPEAKRRQKLRELSEIRSLDLEEPVLCGFTETFFVRRLCIYLDQHPGFDAFVFVLVIVSCICLVISPQYPDIPGSDPVILYATGNTLNVIFTMGFLLEFCVHAMARGFINTRHAYLSVGWNRLDFAILIFALVDLTGTDMTHTFFLGLSCFFFPLNIVEIVSTLPLYFWLW